MEGNGWNFGAHPVDKNPATQFISGVLTFGYIKIKIIWYQSVHFHISLQILAYSKKKNPKGTLWSKLLSEILKI